jgi:hypothetical protein
VFRDSDDSRTDLVGPPGLPCLVVWYTPPGPTPTSTSTATATPDATVRANGMPIHVLTSEDEQGDYYGLLLVD